MPSLCRGYIALALIDHNCNYTPATAFGNFFSPRRSCPPFLQNCYCLSALFSPFFDPQPMQSKQSNPWMQFLSLPPRPPRIFPPPSPKAPTPPASPLSPPFPLLPSLLSLPVLFLPGCRGLCFQQLAEALPPLSQAKFQAHSLHPHSTPQASEGFLPSHPQPSHKPGLTQTSHVGSVTRRKC